ncbi:Glutamate-gated chloride channel [Nymphon striatum]|nr:Glutamate-gated chloride channel [Nymphon striatum]
MFGFVSKSLVSMTQKHNNQDERMLRYEGGIFCPMDFTYFPLDVQICTFYIETGRMFQDQASLKAVDIWYLGCLVCVLLVLLETILVVALSPEQKKNSGAERKRKLVNRIEVGKEDLLQFQLVKEAQTGTELLPDSFFENRFKIAHDLRASLNLEKNVDICEMSGTKTTGKHGGILSKYLINTIIPHGYDNLKHPKWHEASISMDEIILSWKAKDPIKMHGKFYHTITQYDVMFNAATPEISTFQDTYNISVLPIEVKFKRKFTGHIYSSFLPSILFVIVSWHSLFIPRHYVQPRITLSITTVLTIATLSIKTM